MDNLKVRKLREKLGISVVDQQEAAGKSLSPNLQEKVSGYSEAGGRFKSAPETGGRFKSAPETGGRFKSAPGTGGRFKSAP